MEAEAYRWRCACCGEEQTGLPMHMHFGPPVDFHSLDPETLGTVLLDSDFCSLRYPDGEVNRFILCLLPLHVPKLSTEFCFGVWMSVSENSWDIYRAGFGHGTYEAEGCFGYLTHEIPGFEGSAGLNADIFFEPDGLRPTVMLQHSDHPLYAAQNDGIDIAQVERWAALMHGSGQ